MNFTNKKMKIALFLTISTLTPIAQSYASNFDAEELDRAVHAAQREADNMALLQGAAPADDNAPADVQAARAARFMLFSTALSNLNVAEHAQDMRTAGKNDAARALKTLAEKNNELEIFRDQILAEEASTQEYRTKIAQIEQEIANGNRKNQAQLRTYRGLLESTTLTPEARDARALLRTSTAREIAKIERDYADNADFIALRASVNALIAQHGHLPL